MLVAIFGVPLLADRIAPLIPLSVEHRLGDAMDAQVRAMLDDGSSGKPFECGGGDGRKGRPRGARHAGRPAGNRGRAADSAQGRGGAAAARPTPLHCRAGTSTCSRGSCRQSRSADELAGVIAHEIGHVAHRDGTRSLLQAAGLSFLFGMLLGDFTGGGAGGDRGQDGGAVGLFARGRGRGRSLWSGIDGAEPAAIRARSAAILDRIAGAIEPGSKILLDHPQTKDRVAAINAAADRLAAPTTPLLAPPEWAALKRICG